MNRESNSRVGDESGDSMKWTTQVPTERGFYWVKWIEVPGEKPGIAVASVFPIAVERPDDTLAVMFYDQFLPIDAPELVAWSDAPIPKPEE